MKKPKIFKEFLNRYAIISYIKTERCCAEVIQYGLRVGDAFTPYSSCQFLLMVLDVSCQNAEEIGTRIAEEFLKLDKVYGDVYLQFSVYPVDEGGSVFVLYMTAGVFDDKIEINGRIRDRIL